MLRKSTLPINYPYPPAGELCCLDGKRVLRVVAEKRVPVTKDELSSFPPFECSIIQVNFIDVTGTAEGQEFLERLGKIRRAAQMQSRQVTIFI